MNINKIARHLARLTLQLSGEYQDKYTRLAEERGLCQAELRCLRFFGPDNGLKNREIAKRMNLSDSRLTRIIDGLVDKGYMIREYNRKDWRALKLTLTRKGKALNRKLDNENVEIHYVILKDLKSSQRKPLISAMNNLYLASEKRMRKHRR